jgi:hypothetical protein
MMNMGKLGRRFFGAAVLGLGVMSAAGCGESDARGAEQALSAPGATSELRLVTPDAERMPEEARAAILAAVQARPELKGPVSLINLRWEGSWALGTLTTANLDAAPAEGQETLLDLENLRALLLVQTESGWQAAIEGDEHVQSLLARVPESELAPSARSALFQKDQLEQEVQAQAYAGYKFFWPSGYAWRVTQGWHDPTTWSGQFPAYNSLDFDITGATNSDILASAPGTVTYMCNDGTQVLVVVTTSGTTEKLGYLHLDTATVNAAGITQGTTVTLGRTLGRMVNSDGGSVVTNCGQSYGTHLHMYFPYRPITIDGVTFSDTNVHIGENLYSTQGGGTTPTEIVVDDTSSGFTKYGPTTYWYQASIGYGSHMWYTYVNGSTLSNYARWKPSLPSAGNYTVYAYIPSNYATSQLAKYRVYHNGASNYATVNQNAYYNQWVSLGQHYFAANGTEYVELTDNTGEAVSTYRMIGFDAIKFVK